MIEKQSRLAAVDDEELQDSFTNILRVVPKVGRALKLNALAADISAARGMDLAKAGELVGKVAGGNTGILSRYGIVLKKGATAQEALAALQKKFRGQAKAYGDSVAGAGDRVKVAMENIAETVGEMVFPLAGKVLSAFSDALAKVQEFVDKIGRAKGFKAKLNVVWTGVREAGRRLLDVLEDALLGAVRRSPIVADSGKLIKWRETRQGGVVKAIQDGLRNADWSEVGKRIGDGISSRVRIGAEFIGNALSQMNSFIDQHLDELAEVGAKLLVAIFSKLMDPAFWARNWELALGVAIAVFPIGKVFGLSFKIVRALLGPIAKLLPAGFKSIGDRVVTAILGALGRLPGLVQRVILAAVSGALRVLGRLVSYLTGVVRSTLGKVPFWIQAAFRLSFFMAFVNAIKNGWERVRAATKSAVDFITRQWGRISGPIGRVIGLLQTVWSWLRKLTREPWKIVIDIPRPSLPDLPFNIPTPGIPFIDSASSTGPTRGIIGRAARPVAAVGGEVRVIVVGGDQAAIDYLTGLNRGHMLRNGGRPILAT